MVNLGKQKYSPAEYNARCHPVAAKTAWNGQKINQSYGQLFAHQPVYPEASSAHRGPPCRRWGRPGASCRVLWISKSPCIRASKKKSWNWSMFYLRRSLQEVVLRDEGWRRRALKHKIQINPWHSKNKFQSNLHLNWKTPFLMSWSRSETRPRLNPTI